MTTTYRYSLFWIISWATIVLVFLQSRGLMPIDETRYIAVAWEMWTRDSYLVPHLNGATYSHKPPLLFWLTQLGWLVFGVNDWWPRLVPSLFSLASLALLYRFSLRLWPDRPDVARLAPTLLLGSLLWIQFTSAAMFDTILSFWVLLAVYSVYRASQSPEKRMSYWLLAGAATGLGLLTKGPVMLLHILPIALLAPLWAKHSNIHWGKWYASILGMVLISAAIILAWAIPAAIQGGDAYAQSIFWGQTANRVVHSMAHRKSWWWYFPMLPAILFPWFIWPVFWKAIARTTFRNNPSLLFCLLWLLPVFFLFVMISGKQAHYLLPVFPAFSLLAAYALSRATFPVTGRSQLVHSLVFLVLGILLLSTPYLKAHKHWPAWIDTLSPIAGITLIILAVIIVLPWRTNSVNLRVISLSAASMITALVLNLIFTVYMLPRYDLRQISRYIHTLQERNIPVANLGKYHGQFQFYGRLVNSIAVVHQETINEWINSNPQGYVITYPKKPLGSWNELPRYQQEYRGRWIRIWSADQIKRHPNFEAEY